ncbi:MAG: TrpR-like protein YerC/YecD [Ruminococcaceae bacterium]|nr:TrpR-like protein YerC/YecD [Oscillospiraceae bacterium]
MDLFENEGYQLLIKALVSMETEEECKAFLNDLMTRKELADIAQRILVAKMLSEQAVYNKIVEETGASTATISRVNRCYLYGDGGYTSVLKKMKEESV